MAKRIGVYAGSFDPFTVGHESIVERALCLFDEVVIALGVNDLKRRSTVLEEEIVRIDRYFAHEPRVQVVKYEGLTVDFVEAIGGSAIVRGVRDVKDFEYERAIADVNRSISGVETIFFSALPVHSHVSSSIVRELNKYGREVSVFLPKEK